MALNLPETFTERIRTQLGEDDYQRFLASYEQGSLAGIRLNRLKITPEEWAEIDPWGLQPIPWIDNGYYYDPERISPAKHPYYFAGLYYIQEPSAMTPANVLPVTPGDRVLDLCAAPGGKTTELGAKLGGQGVLVTNDISATRAKALVKNVGVFGIRNALVVSEEPQKLAQVFPGYFDKILIDAPCSGEGMFRREPVIMKNWEQYGTGYYADLQRQIVKEALKMLRPGGMLLYSTCTFSPEEDEGTVSYMLGLDPGLHVMPVTSWYDGFDHGHPAWVNGPEELKNCVRIWPHRMGGEGHFLALLVKDGAESGKRLSGRGTARGLKLTADEKTLFEAYGLTAPEMERLQLVGEKMYLVPEGLPEIRGLRVLRNGLYVGDRKKGRFEFAEPFAMSLAMQDVPHYLGLSIDDPNVIRYLKCETIEVPDGSEEVLRNDSDVDAGNYLIGVGKYPLGFGKKQGETIKNKYFHGWRWM